MRSLSIDLETFSSADLSKCGVYRYAESPDFEILLFGCSADGEPVQVVDLASGETLPEKIRGALTDDSVLKWAHNAQFERVCLSRYLGRRLRPDSWRCTMVWSACLGLPLSLEGAALAAGAEKRKLSSGKELVRYFCAPCRPTKANGGRTRNLPTHAPEKWERFKAYNLRDVETEREIARRFSRFPVPEEEWKNYALDQEINDRGIRLDRELVRQAIRCDRQSGARLSAAMRDLTGLENPNSVVQMKAWLAQNGLQAGSLDKAAVAELLKMAPAKLSRVLALRQNLSKSSVKKYAAMEHAVCADSRARGLLQFYGASRTGRFAGRLVQVQNLPQNHLPDLGRARQLVKDGNFAALEALYDSVPAVLSELIRTAFIPKPGCKFIVSDFSSIERVVLAWLAGETWVLDAYRLKKDLYRSTASQMFRVPEEQIDKRSPLRQKGKVADLACGYGGSVGALKAMGALGMGLSEEELPPLVAAWRGANPNIVRFWRDVDRAAVQAVREKTETRTRGIRFSRQSGFLFVTLLSGRRLAYVRPCVEPNAFGNDSVTYMGVGAAKKWERIESYGPKLVENIVQAVSRDILCHAMRRVEDAGYPIVMHVHDEIVAEAPAGASVSEVCRLMGETPPWAPGLPLRADGYECPFYRKD